MTTDTRILDVVHRAFAKLDASGARHVHMKSGPRVLEGLGGRADIDLLVDAASASIARDALRMAGFARLDAVPHRRLRGVEDHLALDAATGILVHVHFHVELRLRKDLRGGRLPWERTMLDSARAGQGIPGRVPDPHAELLLVLARAAMRRRLDGKLRDDALRLQPMLDPHAWRTLVISLLSPAAATLLADTPHALPDRGVLRKLRPHVLKRIDTPTGRTDAALSRRVLARLRLGTRWQRPELRPVPDGLLVAVVGADGSGKSTLTKELTAWAGGKFDVVRLYLGSGDGHAAFYRAPLKWRRDRIRRVARGEDARAAPTLETRREASPGDARRALRRVEATLWGITLALEKRAKCRLAAKLKRAGFVVVTDRWPQTQVEGALDGPLLGALAHDGGSLAARLAAWERRVYEEAARGAPPDVVLQLRVSPEVALRRKPDHAADHVTRRTEVVDALTFPAPTLVRPIDADLPRDEVERDAKLATWSALAERAGGAALPPRPIVIEFTGLPGVGKTTILRAARRELEARGVRSVTTSALWAERAKRHSGGFGAALGARVSRALEVGSFCARRAPLIVSAHACTAAIRPLELDRVRRATTMVRIGATIDTLIAQAHRERAPVVLLEQGPLQEIWSASVGGTLPPPHLVAEVRKRLGTLSADLVVMPIAPLEMVLSRIMAREHGHSRFDKMTPEEAAPLLTQYAQRFADTPETLVHQWAENVLSLDAQAPIETNAGLVADRVQEVLASLGGGGP